MPAFARTLCAAALGAATLAMAQTAPPQRDAATLAREEAAIKAARIAQTQAMAVDDLDKVVTWWVPDITIRRALGQPVDGAVPEDARLFRKVFGDAEGRMALVEPLVGFIRESLEAEGSTPRGV